MPLLGREIAGACAGHDSAQDLRLVIYGLRHHTARSGHHDHCPAKRSGLPSQSVRTKSRNASLWPVVYKKCRSCRATGVAFSIIWYSLSPLARHLRFRGYSLTRAIVGGIGRLLGSGGFPLGSPRPLQVPKPPIKPVTTNRLGDSRLTLMSNCREQPRAEEMAPPTSPNRLRSTTPA
jgi:hypothetical protein